MTDPQEVINEMRPMLEEFLRDVGIFEPGQPISDAQVPDRFSDGLCAHANP